MIIRTLVLSILIIGGLTSPAFAERVPRSGKADARVKTLTYHENDVYRLRGHYGFTTTIEFSPKERIETISVGDSEAWQIIKPGQPNILFVKPLEENAETNMTVLTSSRVYTFDMSAARAASPASNALTFRIKFIYPEEQSLELANFTGKSSSFNPLSGTPATEWNFDYSYSGDKRLRPERVFDDGAFTYFLMKNLDVMPAAFAVDQNGNESIVNFTVQGKYLVINRVGAQFTLRDGNTATCIFNESYEQVKGKQVSIVPIETLEKKKPQKATSTVKKKSTPEKLSKNNVELLREEDTSSFFSFLDMTASVDSSKLNQ